MQRYLFVLAMVLTLTISAFAQPELVPPFQQPPPPPPPVERLGGMPGIGMNALDNLNPVTLVILPEGVFVLRGGVLARFDAGTLQPAGVLELFGPPPAPPAQPQDRTALQEWMQQAVARSAPAAILEQDGKLYIVVGSSYFRVDSATLRVDANGDLGVADNNPRPVLPAAAPQLKLRDGVLYIVLGQELLTVEPNTGKVDKRVALPAELFPALPVPVGGGGAPFAEGRGNRRNGQ